MGGKKVETLFGGKKLDNRVTGFEIIGKSARGEQNLLDVASCHMDRCQKMAVWLTQEAKTGE